MEKGERDKKGWEPLTETNPYLRKLNEIDYFVVDVCMFQAQIYKHPPLSILLWPKVRRITSLVTRLPLPTMFLKSGT